MRYRSNLVLYRASRLRSATSSWTPTVWTLKQSELIEPASVGGRRLAERDCTIMLLKPYPDPLGPPSVPRTNSSRVFGDTLAHTFCVSSPDILITRSFKTAQVAVNRLSLKLDQLLMTPRIPPEDTFIAGFHLAGNDNEVWKRGRRHFSYSYSPNEMYLANLVDEWAIHPKCPLEALVFYIPRSVLNELADEAGVRRVADLDCVRAIIDPVVINLAAILLPVFDDLKGASALFVDQVVQTLCVHLTLRYGGFQAHRVQRNTGLTPRQAARAKEFMAARCADDITLADVAEQCGLSRGHFVKAFRLSTGTTPHQWRQRYRVQRAQSLLTNSAASIADIALTCGFADQSHLTRVFGRLVGQSPAVWRRCHRE